MSDITNPPNNVISTNAAHSLASGGGFLQLSIGNAATDSFGSASIVVKLGNYTLPGLGAITAPHVVNLHLTKGDVLTLTSSGGGGGMSITVTLKPITVLARP